jgi:hypothetical protein
MEIRAMSRSTLVLALLTGFGAVSLALASPSRIAPREGADTSADLAIARLETRIPGIDRLLSRSYGILIFPTIGQTSCQLHEPASNGMLRIRGANDLNYTLNARAPLQFCAQHPESLFVLFMTPQALQAFVAQTQGAVNGEARADLLEHRDMLAGPDILSYLLIDSGISMGTSLRDTEIKAISS